MITSARYQRSANGFQNGPVRPIPAKIPTISSAAKRRESGVRLFDPFEACFRSSLSTSHARHERKRPSDNKNG